jgi:integrase
VIYPSKVIASQQNPNIGVGITKTSDEFKVITVEKGIRQIGPARWEVRVYAGRHPETGAIRHVSRSTTAGIKAARALKAKLATEVAEGKHGSNAGTFGQLLDIWLRDGKQGRAPATLDGYRINIESTIRPALGSILLDKLTARHLDCFYARLIKEGTSPAMVMHHHRVISAALRQGEKWDMVPASAARNASPPTVPTHVLTVPPPERVRALIDAAAASRIPEMAALITVAALTGMRRGELCGLRWDDVDWQGSALTVNRSIWQTRDGWGVKEPKTRQVRRLALGEHAMAVLAGRWQRVSDAVTLAEIRLSEDAYVFSPELDGTAPRMPNTLTRAFRNLCRAMEAKAERDGRKLRPEDRWPYRFHDLRHYTATELFRAGHHARTVADRLGHADPALTLRVYTHDTQDQAIAAAASLEAGITG